MTAGKLLKKTPGLRHDGFPIDAILVYDVNKKFHTKNKRRL
jgi:hypothetical protein